MKSYLLLPQFAQQSYDFDMVEEAIEKAKTIDIACQLIVYKGKPILLSWGDKLYAVEEDMNRVSCNDNS